MYPAYLRGPRVLQALRRYHTLLRLISLDAPTELIAHSQGMVDASLMLAHIDEEMLALLYPAYRLGHIDIPDDEEN
jgi:hypothetical protein